LTKAKRARDNRLALPVIVPNKAVAITAALGYEAFAADMLWLRTLEYFGDSRYAKAGFPAMVPLFERITEIDDRFCAVYRQAGLALTVNEVKRVDVANDLLRRGMRACPNDPYIPFVLGFNLYFFQRKYAEASVVLLEASTRPGSQPWVAELAARVGGSAEDLDSLETMLAVMIEAQPDDRSKEQMEQRLLRVKTEKVLRRVDEALKQAHEPVSSVAQLVAKGYLKAAPRDPSGGEIVIEDGQAMSTKQKKRLRLDKDDVFHEVWE
jgi:hypothetical protein